MTYHSFRVTLLISSFPTLVNKKKNSFTQREIGDSANNLVIRSLRPASLGEIPEERLRKLRAYSQGLIAPMINHMELGIIRPEEIVAVLATGALFIQLKHVMRTDKLPLGPKVNEIYEGDEAVVLPEDYLSVGEPTNDEILPRIGRKKRGTSKTR